MAQFLQIHPQTPQLRLVRIAASILRDGGLIVYPTDSTYALGCRLDAADTVARMRRIRGISEGHDFALVCASLSELGTYAKVDNAAYRILRSHTPGPYTFILPATREVPRRVQNPKRRTIGLRIPDCVITRVLLAEFGEPVMSSTLILPGHELAESDPQDIRELLEHEVDAVIDGGPGGVEFTTVVDLIDPTPRIVRQGLGVSTAFPGG